MLSIVMLAIQERYSGLEEVQIDSTDSLVAVVVVEPNFVTYK